MFKENLDLTKVDGTKFQFKDEDMFDMYIKLASNENFRDHIDGICDVIICNYDLGFDERDSLMVKLYGYVAIEILMRLDNAISKKCNRDS